MNHVKLKMVGEDFWLHAVVRDPIGRTHEIPVSRLSRENAVILLACGVKAADNDETGRFLVSLMDVGEGEAHGDS